MMPPDPDRSHQTRWPPEASRSVEVGGVHWHLRRLGSGPPLVLLHGSASSGHAWAGVASRLRSDFSLVIPDFPGHGHSAGFPDAFREPDDLVQGLEALLEAEGIEHPLLAGHSVGAVVALRLASAGRREVAGVLGVNPALGPRSDYLPPAFEGPARLLAEARLPSRLLARAVGTLPLAELLLKSTGSRITPAISQHYRELLSDPKRVRGVLRLQAIWDAKGVGAAAAQLGIPIHLLTGERDRWVTPETVRRHAAGLPLESLSKRGHLLPEEDPEAVAQAIRRLAEEAGIMPSHGAPSEPPAPDPE